MTHDLFHHARMTQAAYRDLDPRELVAHPGSARLIDVREPHEFNGELGHVDGAELVPLATVPEQAAAWDRDETLVIICRSGARSGRAAQALTEMGFQRVMNMSGGMIAWNQAGLPIRQS